MDEKNFEERRELHNTASESDGPMVNHVMRHRYRVLSEAEKIRVAQIKDLGQQFETLCDELGASRELAIAKTKIEEATMWAVKYVTR